MISNEDDCIEKIMNWTEKKKKERKESNPDKMRKEITELRHRLMEQSNYILEMNQDREDDLYVNKVKKDNTLLNNANDNLRLMIKELQIKLFYLDSQRQLKNKTIVLDPVENEFKDRHKSEVRSAKEFVNRKVKKKIEKEDDEDSPIHIIEAQKKRIVELEKEQNEYANRLKMQEDIIKSYRQNKDNRESLLEDFKTEIEQVRKENLALNKKLNEQTNNRNDHSDLNKRIAILQQANTNLKDELENKDLFYKQKINDLNNALQGRERKSSGNSIGDADERNKLLISNLNSQINDLRNRYNQEIRELQAQLESSQNSYNKVFAENRELLSRQQQPTQIIRTVNDPNLESQLTQYKRLYEYFKKENEKLMNNTRVTHNIRSQSPNTNDVRVRSKSNSTWVNTTKPSYNYYETTPHLNNSNVHRINHIVSEGQIINNQAKYTPYDYRVDRNFMEGKVFDSLSDGHLRRDGSKRVIKL